MSGILEKRGREENESGNGLFYIKPFSRCGLQTPVAFGDGGASVGGEPNPRHLH